VITYVNPAVAVALGVGVLGEPLTPEIIAAFGLILAGSVLATQSGRPAVSQAGELAGTGEADEPGTEAPATARS
jgi:drug/metabolite transporter (DMT)-like permease